MTEILELSDKDFKGVMIKILPWAIMNMLVISKKKKSLSKQIENIKTNQMQF